MRNVLKSGFIWQFAGGFLLGAIGMVTLQPGEPAGTIAATMGAATMGMAAQADR